MVFIVTEQSLSCSNHQQRWCQLQQEYDLSRFNLPFLVKLKGAVDVERFEQVMLDVLSQYDIARTSIKSSNGQCQRVVHDKALLSCERLDFESYDALNEYTMNQSLQAFDFEKPPLLYTAVATVGDEVYWLLIMHHIVSDVSTGYVLTQQVHNAYLGDELSPYYGYSEYVNYEESRFEQVGERAIDYIKKHIQNHTAVGFSDKPMDARFSKIKIIDFDADEAHAFHKSVDELKRSFHVILSLPLFLTHYELSKNNKSFMAIPVSERRTHVLKRTPGFISGPMLMGLEVNPGDTLHSLLDKTQRHFINGLKFYLPIGRYQQQVDCDYRVMFNVFDYRAWSQESSEFNMEQQLLIAANTMQLELFWVVYVYMDKIEMVVHYDSSCLDEEKIAAIAERYRHYLLELISLDDVKLNQKI